MLLSIKEYAAKHGKAVSTVQQKIQRGNLPAIRIGNQWCIDSETPYTDHREKSGEYKNWRKKEGA